MVQGAKRQEASPCNQDAAGPHTSSLVAARSPGPYPGQLPPGRAFRSPAARLDAQCMHRPTRVCRRAQGTEGTGTQQTAQPGRDSTHPGARLLFKSLAFHMVVTASPASRVQCHPLKLMAIQKMQAYSWKQFKTNWPARPGS